MSNSLPKSWQLVDIKNLCANVQTTSLRQQGVGSFNYVDISSIDNELKQIIETKEINNIDAPSRARQVIAKDDVLVSTVRPNLNAVALVPDYLHDEICSTGFCVLRPNQNLVQPDYLFAWVRHPAFIKKLENLARGIGYPSVSDEDVKNQQIPLPPLEEQQRIVEILRQTDELRKLRRAANQRASDLLPALFYEMFGDPVTNPKNWETKKVEDTCDLVRGSSPRPQGDPKFYGGSVPRLMVGDITRDGIYVTPRLDSLTEEGAKQSRFMSAGSVVMAVSGTPNTPGLPAILMVDACIHDGFVGFRNLAEELNPDYFVNYLHSRKSISAKEATGATFSNLNTNQVKNWSIPIPPKNKQDEFAEKFTNLLKLKVDLNLSTSKTETLFESLLARAFSGELTAGWRKKHPGLQTSVVVENTEPTQPQHMTDLMKNALLFAEAIKSRDYAHKNPHKKNRLLELSEEQYRFFIYILGMFDDVFTLNDAFEAYSYPDEPLDKGIILKGKSPVWIRQQIRTFAAAGLIKEISLYNAQKKNFFTAYRNLRPEDNTRRDDLAALNDTPREAVAAGGEATE